MSPVYLHHALLHFPIGLFVAAGLVALVSLIKKSTTLDWVVTITLALGVAFGIAVAITGFLSAEHLIEEGHATVSQVSGHRNVALLSFALAIVGLVLMIFYHRNDRKSGVRTTGLILALAAGVAVTVAGDRGGKMIHPSLGLFATEHTHEGLEVHGDDDHDHNTHGDALDHESSEHHGGSDTMMEDATHEDGDHHHDSDMHEASPDHHEH